MISRQYRFHGHNSLRRVYQNGRTVRGPLFAIKYLPNPRRRRFRVAVVVSRKVSRSAVVRNRIRRRLYERVRLLTPKINDAYDMVITVFHDTAATADSDKLDAAVTQLLGQAGIIDEPSMPRTAPGPPER